MRKNNSKIMCLLAIIVILFAVVIVAGCTSSSQQTATPTPLPTTRTIVDAAGRSVTVPDNITRVMVFNTPPLLDELVMMMGKGNTIINGIPASIRLPKFAFLYAFDPTLVNEPDIGFSPTVEQVLSMHPDVVFTDTMTTVSELQNSSIPVVYVGACTDANETKLAMNVMGQVFNEPARAEAYSSWSDAMYAKVESQTASVPMSEKPKVMYFVGQSMSVADGSDWIDAAGGVDVFDLSYNAAAETYPVTPEQLLVWNPDVMVIHNFLTDYSVINNSSALLSINAVKNNKLYPTPIGACWWYRGPETPLLSEWLASKLYPNLVPTSEVVSDTKSFYQEFFNYNLTDQQAYNILGGNVNVTSMTVNATFMT